MNGLRSIVVLALGLAALSPRALLAGSDIKVTYYDGHSNNAFPGMTTKLNAFLEEHPELTAKLGNKPIVANVGTVKAGNAIYIELKYPNGASTTVELKRHDGYYLENYESEYKQALVDSAGLASLTPDAVDGELKWIREQLAQRLPEAGESDAAVIEKLIARIDKISAPTERAGLLRRVPKPADWLNKNYKTFAGIRDEAKVWGKEMGFDIISFEEKRMLDQAPTVGQRFLQPVRTSDRPLAEKVWDQVDGKDLRGAVEARGGRVTIAFEEPTWAIEPKGQMPGRAALKAVVTVARADGTAQTIDVVAKINSSSSLEKIMAKNEWLKPFATEFQAKVANDFVAIDAFLATPAKAVAPAVSVAGVVGEPADCNAAVDAVTRVLGN